MKQILLFCLISTLIISCKQSKEDKIKSEAKKVVEEKLLPTLKDPKSFEFSEIQIDTITEKEYAQSLIVSEESLLNSEKNLLDSYKEAITEDITYKEKYDNQLKEVENSQKRVDSLKNVSSDNIRRLEIIETYRAKNSFGALEIGKVKVYYVPSDNTYTYIGE